MQIQLNFLHLRQFHNVLSGRGGFKEAPINSQALIKDYSNDLVVAHKVFYNVNAIINHDLEQGFRFLCEKLIITTSSI
jgi:hypothetical protein